MGRERVGEIPSRLIAAFSCLPSLPCLWTKSSCLAALAASLSFSAPAAAKLRLPLFSGPTQQRILTYGLGDWSLRIVTKTFSGDVRCRLATNNGRIVYVANALGIRFSKHAPVTDAWVKIDDGAAQRWRDMLPALATQRTPIDGRDMDSPTDGIVWLPIAVVEEADTVLIQLREDKHAEVFSLARFSELREAGRRLGCDPETRFIR
jgi:hypothetical protein